MSLKKVLERHYITVLVTPFFLFLILLLVYPLFFIVYVSLNQMGITGNTSFIGASNYLNILIDAKFWHSIWVTTRFSILTLFSSMIAGVSLAVIFNSVNFPGKKIVMGLIMIPMLMTPASIGLLWQQLFNPMFGVLNRILTSLSLPTSLWISSSRSSLGSVALVTFWRVTPFILLVSNAGLAMIPRELYDASKVDGANVLQELLYITIPSLRNLLVIVFIFQMVTVIKTFEIIFIMTYGGPVDSTLTIYLYTFLATFEYGKVGYGSTLGIVLFLIILVLSFLSIRARRGIE